MSERRTIRTIDAHTAGEPLRVIVDGYPELPGDTILSKRRYARAHHDDLRRALMLEPRGHADMYGAIVVPPTTPDGDVGVLFVHNEGYSTMCGHGIIALCTVGIEHELFAVDRDNPIIRIDTPAGRVTATARLEAGRVTRVSFVNVPSFVLAAKFQAQVPALGTVTCDVAFGGAFYAYVDAPSIGLELEPANHDRIVAHGRAIKRAVIDQLELRHPDGDADLEFLYGTIFTQAAPAPVHSRNVCVFADGEVDRSPTGTGVSGRAAIHHARGEIATGQTITVESLIGSTFDVRVVEPTRIGDLDAVIPEVSGSAHVTGLHQFIIDPDDPFAQGFLLR